MNFTVKQLKYDCRAFRGDVPCQPHKQYGVHCVDDLGRDCSYYDPVTRKILIIKLGALGDVVRTTPLVRKLRGVEPHAQIWWLTNTPEIVPKSVDVILPYTSQSIVTLLATEFDVVYSLDKDKEGAALCSQLRSRTKRGFSWQNGKCIPIDQAAEHKYMTGVFDDVSKLNTRSYQDEIFEICGFRFGGEEYILPDLKDFPWMLPPKKKIVGLNTGCGGRWTSRLWPEKYWITLAKQLKRAGYLPLLLGGEQEHAKNKRIARLSGARYLGHFPLSQFMSEVNRCDLVVTAVTMAMHFAIGLRKNLILFNNIFNKHEFELYGRGEILEPDFECTCFYSPICPNNCMQYLAPDTVMKACQRWLKPL